MVYFFLFSFEDFIYSLFHKTSMEKRINRFLYYSPRLLGLLFVAFLALFSLDVFGTGLGFWETLLGLFIHNIPSLLLLIVVIIAWKYELVGASVFILTGLAYIVMVLAGAHSLSLMFSWSFTIAGPAIAIGILFFLNWKEKKKLRK
jgi:hypothetical protein